MDQSKCWNHHTVITQTPQVESWPVSNSVIRLFKPSNSIRNPNTIGPLSNWLQRPSVRLGYCFPFPCEDRAKHWNIVRPVEKNGIFNRRPAQQTVLIKQISRKNGSVVRSKSSTLGLLCRTIKRRPACWQVSTLTTRFYRGIDVTNVSRREAGQVSNSGRWKDGIEFRSKNTTRRSSCILC